MKIKEHRPFSHGFRVLRAVFGPEGLVSAAVSVGMYAGMAVRKPLASSRSKKCRRPRRDGCAQWVNACERLETMSRRKVSAVSCGFWVNWGSFQPISSQKASFVESWDLVKVPSEPTTS